MRIRDFGLDAGNEGAFGPSCLIGVDVPLRALHRRGVGREDLVCRCDVAQVIDDGTGEPVLSQEAQFEPATDDERYPVVPTGCSNDSSAGKGKPRTVFLGPPTDIERVGVPVEQHSRDARRGFDDLPGPKNTPGGVDDRKQSHLAGLYLRFKFKLAQCDGGIADVLWVPCAVEKDSCERGRDEQLKIPFEQARARLVHPHKRRLACIARSPNALSGCFTRLVDWDTAIGNDEDERVGRRLEHFC